MATVVLKQQQIVTALRSPEGQMYRELQRRGTRVLNEAKRLCPVDNGRLRSSLKMQIRRIDKVPVAVVGTNLQYGLYVHEGTGIYGPRKTPIVPVNKRVLSWLPKRQVTRSYIDKNGKRRNVYAKRVRVFAKQSRGSRPVPFLRDALIQAR